MVEIFKLTDGEFKRPGVVGRDGLEEVKVGETYIILAIINIF